MTRVVSGVNDLQTKYPELSEQWHPTKNGSLMPINVLAHSNRYAWWICNKCGYEWEAKICNRANGRGCPCCSNKVVVKGKNDLATTHPDIAKEWDQSSNGELTPFDVTSGSGKKVSWKCPRGHVYKATILHRTYGAGTNCPICHSGRQTSFAEQALYYYVKKLFPNAVNGYKEIFAKGMELDIYIPELQLGIEYDGVYWHHKKPATYEREERKYKICRTQGIKLLRIREKRVSDTDFPAADICFFMPEDVSGSEALNQMIQRVLADIDPASNMWTRKNPFHYMSDVSVDVDRDRFEIMAYLRGPVKNSVAEVAPELIEEWDYNTNGNLKPDMIAAGTSFPVNWICKKCHYHWPASAYSRIKGHTGCPKCAGMVFEKGVNDLETKFPELLQDWDYEKNNALGIYPDEIPYNLMKKVYWRCHVCGHKWSVFVNSRTTNGRGCIKCGYKVGKALKHKNMLAERGCITDELLLKEWDYEKNSVLGITPENTIPQSVKQVFWICSICGNRWKIAVARRTKGAGCRKCVDKANPDIIRKTLIAKGHALNNPLLEKEWDYDKNEGKPSDYTYGSGKKAHWKCSTCGHSWYAQISSRAKGAGCPACAGNVVVKGKNDLLTVRPDLALEWDYEKNKDVKPEDVAYSSGKKYWWRCNAGHESYYSTLSHRVSGTGCPLCGNRKITEKFSKPVDQFSKDGTFIKTYESAKVAAKAIGVSASAICNAISGKAKSSGGYIWKMHVETDSTAD